MSADRTPDAAREQREHAGRTPSWRRVARRLGVGRALLRVADFRTLGPRRAYAMALARRRVLPRITQFEPLHTADGHIEVHMLLNHPRIFEGLWAFYSLFATSDVAARIIIHDDGTLTLPDVSLIRYLFPRARIISRPEADAVVLPALADRGLTACLELRAKYVHSLKLLDVPLFTDTDDLIVLDSDVIFWHAAEDLFDSGSAACYMPDVTSHYAGFEPALQSVAGIAPVPSLNSGLLRAPLRALSLELIEQCLAIPNFWSAARQPSYYTELILWAMWMRRAGGVPLNPAQYAIAPSHPPPDEVVAAHYCGGRIVDWIYQTQALPELLTRLQGVDTSADPSSWPPLDR